MSETKIISITPDKGVEIIPFIRHITTVGSNPQNEIVLDGDVPAFWLRINLKNNEFFLESLEKQHPATINGKKLKSCKLKHGDSIKTPGGVLLFWKDALKTSNLLAGNSETEGYKGFIEASKAIAEKKDFNHLLATLLDSVISLSKSEKGFIVLAGEEKGAWEIKFARNIKHQDIIDARGRLSDSIVNKVLERGEPVVLSDALSDENFSGARSIIALKLQSVLCVPLKTRGELLGCIYIGNHEVINIFSDETVNLISAFSTNAALLIKNALLIHELTLNNSLLQAELESRRFGEIVGSSPNMQEVFSLVRKVAPTDVSVLIEGNTGTGKELIARQLHNLSLRAEKQFVTINCGAIPETLLESELFGYKKGAFTGAAADRKGKVMAAAGGTLFLDEISEMPLALQVKLLQLLQNRVVTPIGDTKEYPVDIRVIAATNRHIAEEVEKGRFRSDLYYRLNVISIKIPPLKERGDDVILLARYFLDLYSSQYKSIAKRFDKSALAMMMKYEWPGNVRELENIVRQAVVLVREPFITQKDIGLAENEATQFQPLAEAKNNFSKEYIKKAIDIYEGNRNDAAKALGIDARTIRRLLNE